MIETAAGERLRRLALWLLVGGPYSTDGVPAAMIAAAWPRDEGFAPRARDVSRLVADMAAAGQASLMDVRYASERATAASTRSIPVDTLLEDPVGFFSAGELTAGPGGNRVPHVFAEESLERLMWPGDQTRTVDGEAVTGGDAGWGPTGQGVEDGLRGLHALCRAAAAVGGPAAGLHDRLPGLLDLLAGARFVGAEPPSPAASSVMLMLSAVVGADGANRVHEVAGVLAYVRDRSGWSPAAEPWGTPGGLFGEDAWLACP